MTRELRNNKTDGIQLVTENCKCSGYTMAAVAACLVFCLGIIVYALICG